MTKDTKYTWPTEHIVLKSGIPAANHYKATNMDVVRKAAIVNSISKSHLPRFKPTEKTLAPSPSSYNTTKVDDFFRKTKFEHKFGNDKRTSFVDKINHLSKKNKSPGAGHYKLVEAAY